MPRRREVHERFVQCRAPFPFRDFPVVQGVVILGGIMIVVTNLLIDIVYAMIDPRIRMEA